MAPKHVAVLGAGPAGLEVGLRLANAGVQVTVFERGGAAAANVRDWGHVRLFSPNSMNVSVAGRPRVPSANVPPRGSSGTESSRALWMR